MDLAHLDIATIIGNAGAAAPWMALAYVVTERWRATLERALTALQGARVIIEPASSPGVRDTSHLERGDTSLALAGGPR